MDRKLRMGLVGIIVLVLITLAVFVQAQGGQKVTLRYKLNIGDTWKYECTTESEGDQEAPAPRGKSLRYIKENFKYEVLEITSEGYTKTKVTTVPIESKGVNIDMLTGERDEMHDFVAGSEYEEIVNPRGEIVTFSYKGPPESFLMLNRKGGAITTTLAGLYEDIIRYLHPVMPENEVGINSTWSYPVYIVSVPSPSMDLVTTEAGPVSINYKVMGFEEKNGFNCVKIEYNYAIDYTDAIDALSKTIEPETAAEHRWELRIESKGTIYFAYNEGLMVYRKENLLRTSIETDLVDDKWELRSKRIGRIGFTMNYIKP